MFTIIGGDGKEYGPVSADQIRGWIAAGRANLDTKARAAGSDAWQPLRDFPDFSPDVPPPLFVSSPTAVATAPLASRLARTSAALINALLYFFTIMPASVQMSRKLLAQNPELAKGKIPSPDQLDLSGLTEAMLWFWASLFAAMLAQALLIAWRGQNIGKLLLGIRVVRCADDQPAGLLRGALLRFLVPVTVMILLHATTLVLGLLLLVIDYAFMLRDDRRCLHDLIAGTKVIRA